MATTGKPNYFKEPVTFITGTTTLTSADGNIIAATLGGAANLNLPDSSLVGTGFVLEIRRIDAVVANLTVIAAVGETISGAASVNVAATQYLRLVADSANNRWILLTGPS